MSKLILNTLRIMTVRRSFVDKPQCCHLQLSIAADYALQMTWCGIQKLRLDIVPTKAWGRPSRAGLVSIAANDAHQTTWCGKQKLRPQ
jgi:hypothetical protein